MDGNARPFVNCSSLGVVGHSWLSVYKLNHRLLWNANVIVS